MGKTILITGASSGFGLMLATDLHKKGFNVIGTSREPQKYQNNVPFQLLKLDLSDDASIASFAEHVFGHTKTVDVLVNNAGYMVTGIAEETSIEVGKQQFETNFWGTVKVTNVLLPYFRKQKYGQIITVSSIVGLIGPPNLSFYSASKHAVEGYFKSLRFELKPFNVNVCMVEPTWFKTNLSYNAHAANGNPIADYNTYRKKVDALTQKGIEGAEDAKVVVTLITKLINTKEPKFSNPVGKMSGIIVFLQSFAPKIFEKIMIKNVNKVVTN